MMQIRIVRKLLHTDCRYLLLLLCLGIATQLPSASSCHATSRRGITAALPAENEIRALAFGPGGQIAIGMAAGVRRYDGTRWHTHPYTSTEGLAPGGVTALAFDSAEQLWAGTPHGVSRFDGQAWRTFTIAAGLPSDAITALYEDRAGRMWIGTQAGITLITED